MLIFAFSLAYLITQRSEKALLKKIPELLPEHTDPSCPRIQPSQVD